MGAAAIIIPAAISVAGMIAGGIRSHRAKKMAVDQVDPRQTLFLSELERKRKLLESGLYYQPEQDAINQQGKQALNTITSLTGGNIGATLNAINVVNRSTGRNRNQLYGNMSIESMRLQSLASNIIGSMTQRKERIQEYQQDQEMAEGKQLTQQGMRGLEGVAAKIAGKIDTKKMWNTELTKSTSSNSDYLGNIDSVLNDNSGQSRTDTTPFSESLNSTSQDLMYK